MLDFGLLDFRLLDFRQVDNGKCAIKSNVQCPMSQN